ncbi:MAG: undecaprenyldiphospho-muramoylpentapeptide beta-N-acetylglucosaminyltransferase [Acidimicrobiia bacterium]|nr:MAG: undecaprenyldiphospho-muramoylpentapeptide beta-N-acetylglucosaminyltransferase [Acidimicrobiia bacterium]
MKVGIAAAGSGGHVYPALAVAESLIELGMHKDDIVFFGGDRMEAEVIPTAGYPFVEVDIHGVRRSLSVDNLTLPLKIRRATRVMSDQIELLGIRAMVVFGGYVSGPAGLAARRTKIPLIIHEANAVPGMANRLLASSADTVFVAFEPATKKLRKGIVVGNPLRSSFESFDREALRPEARKRYGMDQSGIVLGVFGGSLGAAALNEIAAEIASDHTRGFEILQVTGESHFEQIAGNAASVEGWFVVPFETEMELLYAACDVVLSRSGAMTVSELHATATPAILVPLPAGRGYQGLNAGDLVKTGAGIVIGQERRNEIIDTAHALLADEVKRKEMSDTAKASQHHGVARSIAEHVLGLVHD